MRRIFITGASSGIGQALAIKLAQEGHILGLAARRQDKLEQVAQQVQAAGGKAYLYPLDVRDRRQQFEAINHFAGLGGLDAAVANAGFGITKPILATSEEESRELFDVNLFGLLYTLQASAPHLHEGVFVGVSSVVAYALPTGYGVYSASKSAVSSLLTVARREMGHQFKVVLVSPGETQTEFWQVAQKRSGYLIDGRSPVPMASADTVAAVIARAIECPQPNVFMNWTERLLPILRGAFPAVLEHHYRVVEQH